MGEIGFLEIRADHVPMSKMRFASKRCVFSSASFLSTLIALKKLLEFEKNFSWIQRTSVRMFPFWIAAAITAVVSVIYAKVFGWSEELAFQWVDVNPWFAVIITPTAMWLSMALAHFLSPYSSGSGIPQLLAAVEISREPHPLLKPLLSLRVVALKFLGSCVCVMGGGVTGREGPMLQVSAVVFKWVHDVWPERLGKPNLQSMILAGGAAGLASAFNTPLGGIIFAIEELGKVHISHIRTYIFHSVIIAGLIAQAVSGNYLYFGKNEISMALVGELLPFALACLLIGILGALFGWLVVQVLDWRVRLKTSTRFLMTIICGLGVAALTVMFQRAAVGGGRSLIVEILSSQQDTSWSLGFVRFFANFLTYVGGVIGGIFAPALATGAAFGSWLSTLFSSSSSELWALGGMVAFLTGVTRTPFTSMILVLEMSDSHNVIVYLMAAAILAQASAKMVDATSFYEHMAHRLIQGYKTRVEEKI